MSERTASLLAEALKLTEAERIELVDGIDASLDVETDCDSTTDEEFARELNRRHEEYLRDPSVGIPLEEVKRLMKVD